MIFRLAWREVWNAKRFSVLFILNLSLGLFGYVALETFRISLEESLQQNSRNLLGADLNVSSRRDLTSDEMAELDKLHRPVSHLSEVYTMLIFKNRSRLVQVRGVEPGYPFYGQIQIEGKSGLSSSHGRDILENQIWVYPELLIQLGVSYGETVQIGEKEFTVTSKILDDVGALWGSFSLAPRVYVRSMDLMATGLLTKGSLVTHNYLIKLNESDDGEAVSKTLNDKLSDPGLRIVTHTRAGQQSARFLSYFNDYLSLIAVVSVILSSIGSVFLVRSYLQSKIKDQAILTSLGLDASQVQSLFLYQVLLLSVTAAVFSYALGPLLFPVFKKITLEYVNLTLDLSLSFQLLAALIAIASVGTILCLWPQLQRIRKLNPSLLFQETAGREVFGQTDWYHWLPALIFFWVFSVYQAHSLKIGSFFFLGVVVSLGILGLVAGFVLRMLENRNVDGVGVGMTLRNLARNRQSTVSSFLALSLGATILCIIPQVRSSLGDQIKRPDQSLVPSLFLFDIQEEQVSELQNFLKHSGIELQSLSPMVRARLVSLNGDVFKKSNVNDSRFFRENEQADRTRNQTYNLSYRAKLMRSESLVEGREFSGVYVGSGQAELSLETDFAKRLGVKIGDVLKFDVQGSEIEGKIVNLRRVDWTVFQPNFFVVFQSGILEDAPKTYLASIAKVSLEKAAEVQSLLAQKFPNISMIEVSRMIDKLLKIVDILSLALMVMGALSILTGLVVLISVLFYQVQTRMREVVLLKVLGASFGSIRLLFMSEAAFICLAAVVFASFLGISFSFLLSYFLFDGVWSFDGKILIVVDVIIMLFTFVISIASIESAIKNEKAF